MLFIYVVRSYKVPNSIALTLTLTVPLTVPLTLTLGLTLGLTPSVLLTLSLTVTPIPHHPGGGGKEMQKLFFRISPLGACPASHM